MDDELNEDKKYLRLQCDTTTTEQTPPPQASSGDYNINNVLRQRAIYSAPGSVTQSVSSPREANTNDDSMMASYTPGVLSSGRFKV